MYRSIEEEGGQSQSVEYLSKHINELIKARCSSTNNYYDEYISNEKLIDFTFQRYRAIERGKKYLDESYKINLKLSEEDLSKIEKYMWESNLKILISSYNDEHSKVKDLSNSIELLENSARTQETAIRITRQKELLPDIKEQEGRLILIGQGGEEIAATKDAFELLKEKFSVNYYQEEIKAKEKTEIKSQIRKEQEQENKTKT
ncbi:MAG: hypothetical protein FWF57_03525 [Defluviitaleaceae bacterium]|nr:hypothetical protein [Defluviitaleaceae bacterium]